MPSLKFDENVRSFQDIHPHFFEFSVNLRCLKWGGVRLPLMGDGQDAKFTTAPINVERRNLDAKWNNTHGKHSCCYLLRWMFADILVLLISKYRTHSKHTFVYLHVSSQCVLCIVSFHLYHFHVIYNVNLSLDNLKWKHGSKLLQLVLSVLWCGPTFYVLW